MVDGWTMKMHFGVFAFVLSICVCLLNFFRWILWQQKFQLKSPWSLALLNACYIVTLSRFQLLKSFPRRFWNVSANIWSLNSNVLYLSRNCLSKLWFDNETKTELLFIDNFKWVGMNSFNAWMSALSAVLFLKQTMYGPSMCAIPIPAQWRWK